MRRLLRGVHAGLAVSGTALCLLLVGSARASQDEHVYLIVTLVSGLNVLCLAFLKPGRLWAATTVYSGVFWLFHFGLVAVYGLSLVTGEDLSAYVWDWFFRPETRMAAVFSLAGLLAVTVGSYATEFLFPSRTDIVEGPEEQSGAGLRAAATKVGLILVVASVCAWFWAAWHSGGLALLLASYSSYLQALEPYGSLINVIWFAFGFGVVLLMSAEPGRLRNIGLVWFTGFCVVALPLGLRGEVMFPLAAGLVARAAGGRPLPMRQTVVLVGAGLIAIVAVKQVRQVGLGELGATDRNVSIFNAFVELGGSLQPVEKVVTWHEYGDPLDAGATYWAPIDRALYYVIPGWTRLPSDEDARIMNVLVGVRSGPIGFSPVAEAYRNFGGVGVPLVLGLFGIVLGLLERWGGGMRGRLVLATILVPLLINVRNSFVPVPAQIVLGGLLICAVMALAAIQGDTHVPGL